MTKLTRVMRGLAVVSVVALSSTAQASRPMPDTTFACEVQTRAGFAGLLMVQAKDLAGAKAAAKGNTALTLAGKESAATSVVQCIVPAEGQRFSDSQMQRFYEQLPR